jgi:hypothetical protein
MAMTMNNAVFWMLHHVALVRTDISEEHSTSIISVTIIGELGTILVTSNRRMPQRNIIVTSQKMAFFIEHDVSETECFCPQVKRQGRLLCWVP